MTRASIEQFFGPPAESHPDRLVYQLDLWPDHAFDWRIGPSGAAGHDGFRLQFEPIFPTWGPLAFDELTAVLQLGHHTSHDVRRLLGDPDSDESWGSAWQWVYGPQPDGRVVVVDMDYGLVRELRLEPARTL